MTTTTTTTIYIRDDCGHAWYFDGERIRCVLADDTAGNGYHCDSLEDGIRLLNENGHITGFDEE